MTLLYLEFVSELDALVLHIVVVCKPWNAVGATRR